MFSGMEEFTAEMPRMQRESVTADPRAGAHGDPPYEKSTCCQPKTYMERCILFHSESEETLDCARAS